MTGQRSSHFGRGARSVAKASYVGNFLIRTTGDSNTPVIPADQGALPGDLLMFYGLSGGGVPQWRSTSGAPITPRSFTTLPAVSPSTAAYYAYRAEDVGLQIEMINPPIKGQICRVYIYRGATSAARRSLVTNGNTIPGFPPGTGHAGVVLLSLGFTSPYPATFTSRIAASIDNLSSPMPYGGQDIVLTGNNNTADAMELRA